MAQTSTRKQIREAAAGHFGLVYFGQATAIDTTGKTVTIPKLAKVRANRDLFDKAFITKDGDNFELLQRVPDADGLVTLSDNVTGLQSGEEAAVYLLANPEDYNKALDRTLTSELRSTDTYDVTLVAGQNEYALPAQIQSRGDVIDVEFRDASTALVVQSPVIYWRLLENANAVTLHLPQAWEQQVVGSVSIRVTYRGRYAALASDSATTVCPFDLAWSSLAVAIGEFIQSAFGAAMAERFRTPYNQALRRKIDLKAQHMPPITTRNFHWDEQFDQDHGSLVLDGFKAW